MDAILEFISMTILEHVWFAPLLAFVAGVLTSFTPCSLSSVPLVIAYVGATRESNTKQALLLSVIFAIGSAVTFTTLGVAASLLGSFLGPVMPWWYIVLGVLMVVMALQIWEIINIIPSSNLLSKSSKRGALGAFLAGILGGLFSSPCATPILVALLAIVAGSGNLLWGILLLLLYSVGHGILAVITGTSIGLVHKLTNSERYGRYALISRMIMGSVVLLIGFHMFYLGF